MASNYPSGLDTFTNPAGTDNLAAGIGHAAQHDNINDAVRAVEVELGTTPKGSDASVAARLARFDANGFVTPIRTSGGYFDTATNYTLTNNDRVVDVTGTTAITLPTSTGSAGRTFTVRNNGAGTVTIGTTGGQLIDGAATLALAGKGYAEVVSDGTGWHVLGAQYANETVGRRIFTWNHAYSTGGGFQLSYGDTGVRSLTLTPNAPCSTLTVEIRRLGNICHIDVSWLNGVITTPQAEFNLSDTALPSGFGNTRIQRGVAWTNYLASAGGAIHIASGNILKANVVSAGMSAAGGSTMQRSWAYTTLDAWPTVLPGTAVGSIPNA